jgi:hypothetical protein
MRGLCDAVKRCESNVLAQLRTGMARINRYLQRIRAADIGLCDCRQALETIELFLFRCTKWDAQRDGMGQLAQAKMQPLVLHKRKGSVRGPKIGA